MEKNTSTNQKRKEEEIGSKVKKTETETKEETNIRVVREALEAFNSGDVSRVHEFKVLNISIMNHKWIQSGQS